MTRLGQRINWQILLTMMALVITGLVMIFSSSAVSAMEMVGQVQYFFYKQLTWSIIGLIACAVATIVPMKAIKKLTPLIYLSVGVLLVLVLLPFFGRESAGASRWISLGIIGFQPSEFAKIALILTLAYYLSTVELKPNNMFKHLIFALTITFIYAFLIAIEPDLGTATQVAFIGIIMLFLAGFPFSYLISVMTLGTPVIAFTIFSSGYRSERVVAYLNPWSDPYGKGYHIVQSINALARGGLSGLGMGESVGKKGYLPEPYTDSIVAVLGEELGLIGIFFLMVLITYLVIKGFQVSLKARDPFKMLVGTGLAAMVGIQSFLNLAVVSGFIPTTGVAMPFISYGGSSLLINMVAVGLLLNISKGDTNV